MHIKVIGEIVAGVIVGPSVLVGNFGLILFMFNLGLELEQDKIKKELKRSLPIAIGTIVIPYGSGAALSLYLYNINSRDGFAAPDRVSFILFIASSMSFTAFPVLASILSSKNLLTSRIGTLTISCAAIDNIMGWCPLALAGAFAKGSGLVGLWYVYEVRINSIAF
jgi:Kef-type K+ transport system membrane component KefB